MKKSTLSLLFLTQSLYTFAGYGRGYTDDDNLDFSDNFSGIFLGAVVLFIIYLAARAFVNKNPSKLKVYDFDTFRFKYNNFGAMYTSGVAGVKFIFKGSLFRQDVIIEDENEIFCSDRDIDYYIKTHEVVHDTDGNYFIREK